MDRVLARKIGTAAEKAMRTIADRYGVAFVDRGGRYGHDTLTIKIELADIQNGEVQSRAVTDFKRLASRYGLEPDDLGTEFRSGGYWYIITGLNTRAPKYPIKCERKFDGKGYKFTEAQVAFALRRD
jgi:hypothetical protein